MASSLAGAVGEGLKRVNGVFVSLQRAFLFSLMALLTAAMFAEIVTRYFFNTSLFGLEEFVGYTAVWVYFIGAAYGSYERSHIKAEFIDVLFRGPRLSKGIRSIAAAISTWMCIIFTKWSYDFVAESIQMNERSPTHNVPMVYFHSALLVGGVLMTIYFIWETIHFADQAIKEK